MEGTARRTPGVPLGDVFLRAAAGLEHEDARSEVVAEALRHLQRGFEAHYGLGPDGATDDGVLVGDNHYALSVETIARLDEPRFVEVAARMIRDGAGLISTGEPVSAQTWTPHLAGLLDVISDEGQERSEKRVGRAIAETGENVG